MVAAAPRPSGVVRRSAARQVASFGSNPGAQPAARAHMRPALSPPSPATTAFGCERGVGYRGTSALASPISPGMSLMRSGLAEIECRCDTEWFLVRRLPLAVGPARSNRPAHQLTPPRPAQRLHFWPSLRTAQAWQALTEPEALLALERAGGVAQALDQRLLRAAHAVACRPSAHLRHGSTRNSRSISVSVSHDSLPWYLHPHPHPPRPATAQRCGEGGEREAGGGADHASADACR